MESWNGMKISRPEHVRGLGGYPCFVSMIIMIKIHILDVK